MESPDQTTRNNLRLPEPGVQPPPATGRGRARGAARCKRNVSRAAAAVLLCGGAQAALAQAPGAAPTEESFLGEMPVVLSATRLAQPLAESPASITVIDREMIEASGAVDIPDVLRLVPGVQVGHADGTHFVVTYHGLSDLHARRLQVLVDGRSVYTPDFGRVLWIDLPLSIEDIERIEFIRGPNGVTYGANSFVGVINIITRHPAQVPGTYLKATGGSRDTRRVVARYGGIDADTSYRLTAHYRADDGFPALNDHKRIRTLDYRGEYRASSRDSLELQLGFNDNRRGKGSDGPTDPLREMQADSNHQHLRWRRTLSAEEEWSLLFYHNYHRLNDTFQTALLSEILGIPPALVPVLLGVPDQRISLDANLWSERFNLELQHTFSPQRGWRIVWGAETRLDRVRGPGWFDTPDWIETRLSRLFANAEWRLAPDWILNAGTMYEHNDITGGDLSPRLALNYLLAPHHALRASVTRAYRTPSVFEWRANAVAKAADGTVLDKLYVSTASLRPERITSYELGYLGEFPATRAGVDLKLYSERVRDLIAMPVDATGPDEFSTFRNDGEADIRGAEIQVQWRPTPATRLLASQAYANVRGRDAHRFNNGTRLYKNAERLTPTHTQSLLAIHRFTKRLEGSLAYYKVGNMEFDNNDQTGGYDNLEVRLAYRFRLSGTSGELSTVAQHLAGDYFDAERAAVFRKRYFVNLALELK